MLTKALSFTSKFKKGKNMKIKKDRRIKRQSCSSGNYSYLVSAIINLIAALTDFIVGGITNKPLLIVGGVCFAISSILHFTNYFCSRR